MNNILAAQVLRSHLPNITDRAYKTATEIAIEALYQDALEDWRKLSNRNIGLLAREYLELTKEEYEYWIMGTRETRKIRRKK